MLGRQQQEPLRVGIWIAAVAAVAGLLVLLLQGSAHASPQLTAHELATALEVREPLTAEERVSRAEAVLREDRERRFRGTGRALLAAGLNLWDQASPRRLLRNARHVSKALKSLFTRSAAEDVALDLLEPALDHGETSPELEALYSELREREERARVRELLRSAGSALESGHFRLAEVRARRALQIAPDSRLARELLELARTGAHAGGVPESAPTAIRNGDVGFAAALLLEDYERAAALAREDRQGEFGRAVAHFLGGNPEAGLVGLAALASGDDRIAELTAHWLSSPELNPEPGLAQAERRFRIERALGWIGGDELASEGLALSSDAYSVWRASATPGNLALAAPLRIYRGWEPDREELRGAALRYLTLLPNGSRAKDALAWLAVLERSEGRTGSAWDDGRFVLPPARTPYSALAPRPLVLTRELVLSERVRELELLHQTLAAHRGVLLVPLRSPAPAAISGTDALVLFDDLAGGLEAGEVRAHQGDRSEALEALRRMHMALRAGGCIAVLPWSSEERSELASLAAVAERAGDQIRLARGFGAADFDCPGGTVCLDRQRVLQASVWGALALDHADVKIGARTSFQRARFAVELGLAGPRASIVLPLAYWLGFERWLPLEARLGVGLSGISFDPDLDPPPASIAEIAEAP